MTDPESVMRSVAEKKGASVRSIKAAPTLTQGTGWLMNLAYHGREFSKVYAHAEDLADDLNHRAGAPIARTNR